MVLALCRRCLAWTLHRCVLDVSDIKNRGLKPRLIFRHSILINQALVCANFNASSFNQAKIIGQENSNKRRQKDDSDEEDNNVYDRLQRYNAKANVAKSVNFDDHVYSH